MFDSISAWLSTNQFMSGGVVLILVGALVAFFRQLPGQIWAWVLRRITVSVEIRENDESFQWVQMWLAKKLNTIHDMSVYTKQHDEDVTDFSTPVDNRPKIYFTPAPGTHWMFFNGRPTVITRNRNDQTPGGGGDAGGNLMTLLGGAPMKKESITIRFLGRNRTLATSLMEEARDIALPKDNKIDIRVSQTSWGGRWLLADRIRPRPFDSVILDNNQHSTLLKDIKDFLSRYQWYCDMGIPYRRGYLLYGEPGNGKTSLVVAIASALKMNVYVLNLAASSMSDSKLSELLTTVSENSIILIEDVDCAFVQREKKEKDQETLTFSGLLNALDGVSGKDGRIIFMTTNFIERLDEALIREGRIDVKSYLGNAQPIQAKKLFQRFFPDAYGIMADTFESRIPPGTISMAKIQGHLMKYKDSPNDALANLDEILKVRLKVKEPPQISTVYDDSGFLEELKAM